MRSFQRLLRYNLNTSFFLWTSQQNQSYIYIYIYTHTEKLYGFFIKKIVPINSSIRSSPLRLRAMFRPALLHSIISSLEQRIYDYFIMLCHTRSSSLAVIFVFMPGFDSIIMWQNVLSLSLSLMCHAIACSILSLGICITLNQWLMHVM